MGVSRCGGPLLGNHDISPPPPVHDPGRGTGVPGRPSSSKTDCATSNCLVQQTLFLPTTYWDRPGPGRCGVPSADRFARPGPIPLTFPFPAHPIPFAVGIPAHQISRADAPAQAIEGRRCELGRWGPMPVARLGRRGRAATRGQARSGHCPAPGPDPHLRLIAPRPPYLEVPAPPAQVRCYSCFDFELYWPGVNRTAGRRGSGPGCTDPILIARLHPLCPARREGSTGEAIRRRIKPRRRRGFVMKGGAKLG